MFYKNNKEYEISKAKKMRSKLKANSISTATLWRYLRLNNLTSGLIEMVDNKRIPLLAAVELSFINERDTVKHDQYALLEYLQNNSNAKITITQAKQLKQYSYIKPLTNKKIVEIISQTE